MKSMSNSDYNITPERNKVHIMKKYNRMHPYQGRMVMGAGMVNSVKVRKLTFILYYLV